MRHRTVLCAYMIGLGFTWCYEMDATATSRASRRLRRGRRYYDAVPDDGFYRIVSEANAEPQSVPDPRD